MRQRRERNARVRQGYAVSRLSCLFAQAFREGISAASSGSYLQQRVIARIEAGIHEVR